MSPKHISITDVRQRRVVCFVLLVITKLVERVPLVLVSCSNRKNIHLLNHLSHWFCCLHTVIQQWEKSPQKRIVIY